MAHITLADLSCGAGMASRGVIDELNRLGHKVTVLAAVDPWAPAIKSYAANVPEAAPGALLQMKTEDAVGRGLVPKVDVVITGPPCIRDSTLARCRIDRLIDRTAEMAEIKAASVSIGISRAEMGVVMETNRGNFNEWSESLGFTHTRLMDTRLGGNTLRKRTFHLRGIAPAPAPLVQGPGWGDVFPQYARGGAFGLNTDCGLVLDANKVSKRRRLLRPPDLPAPAVIGSGSAMLVYQVEPFKKLHRFTPEEHAILQGFPGLVLADRRVRVRNSLVGNGWPRSFGAWVARSIDGAI